MSLAKGNSRASYAAFISVYRNDFNFSAKFKETIHAITEFLFDAIYAECVNLNLSLGRKTLKDESIVSACKMMGITEKYNVPNHNINIHKYIVNMKEHGARISANFETRMTNVISGLLHAIVHVATAAAKNMHKGSGEHPVVKAMHIRVAVFKSGKGFSFPSIVKQAVSVASIEHKKRRMGTAAAAAPVKKRKGGKKHKAVGKRTRSGRRYGVGPVDPITGLRTDETPGGPISAPEPARGQLADLVAPVEVPTAGSPAYPVDRNVGKQAGTPSAYPGATVGKQDKVASAMTKKGGSKRVLIGRVKKTAGKRAVIVKKKRGRKPASVELECEENEDGELVCEPAAKKAKGAAKPKRLTKVCKPRKRVAKKKRSRRTMTLVDDDQYGCGCSSSPKPVGRGSDFFC